MGRREIAEYVASAVCTLSAILALRILPGKMMFAGAEKASWYLVLLAASPALFTAAFHRMGKRSIFSLVYLVIAELAGLMIVLFNLGKFNADKEAIFMVILTGLLLAEAIHLARKDARIGDRFYMNFKWVSDEEEWKDLQKRSSRLFLAAGIISAILAALLIFGILDFTIALPIMIILLYLVMFIILKGSKK